MKLYHYSKNKFSVLKTLRKQKDLSQEEIEKGKTEAKENFSPGPYYDHVSFFFERPPIESLGSIFEKDHHTWVTGNRLYEHIVDSEDLKDIVYCFVETPLALEMFYGAKYDSLSITEYLRLLKKRREDSGELGKDVKKMEHKAIELSGLTSACYQDIRKRPNWNELKNKYAATVPHLMIYSEKGEFPVKEVNRVTVGNKPLTTKPLTPAFNW